MGNKYYTPDISEFYVGFEYEYKLDDLIWTPMVFGFDLLRLYPESPLKNETRVKRLDEQDILNLGFEITDKTEYSYLYGFYRKQFSNEESLTLTPKEKNIFSLAIEHHYDWEGSNEMHFEIKNKFELKKLLEKIKT